MSEKKPFNVFQEWLDSYLDFEKLPRKDTFWLNTMEYLCDRFDRPESAYRTIHVAGSKGKGSVSVMTASILKEAGFNCGLYTSPHIIDLTERIGKAYEPFTEKVYENAVKEIIPRIRSIIPDELPGGREPTWFELVTLYAFLCFRIDKVDWGVFETGLGGRLDATNVINPDACIITPIELEHTEYLGDTLEKIAYEKAGIIKKDTPVFVSIQQPVCREVFRKKAIEMNAPITFISDIIENVRTEISLNGMKVNIDFGSKGRDFGFSRPINATLPMLGSFQAINAAISALTVKSLYPDINESIIEKGLSQAILPGRFEIVKYPGIPFIVLDGAHTENSVEFTLNTFNDLFFDYRSKIKTTPHLLFACAADKHCTSFAHLISKNSVQFSHCTLTIPGEVKKSDLDKLCTSFSQEKIVFTSSSDYKTMIKESIQQAATEQAPLLVTGSFYLIAEVKKILNDL